MRILSTLVRLLAEFGKSSKPLRCPSLQERTPRFPMSVFVDGTMDKGANPNLLLIVTLALAGLALGWVTWW